jgi:5-methylcytosine-specific restriction endonuclease McrA
VRRVLLLNVTYEPLTTVGLRRAVCLVLGGKAEVVHDDVQGAVLHAASVALATPSVIRLRRYVRVPYRNRVPLTRAALMRRDNYRCAYCGRRAETIDHVVPRSRGGAHAWENCVASCTICNHRKADRLLEELGWTLPVPPAVPRGAHWRLVGAQHDGDPQWAAYLREPSAALRTSAALKPAPPYRTIPPYRTSPPHQVAAFFFFAERTLLSAHRPFLASRGWRTRAVCFPLRPRPELPELPLGQPPKNGRRHHGARHREEQRRPDMPDQHPGDHHRQREAAERAEHQRGHDPAEQRRRRPLLQHS